MNQIIVGAGILMTAVASTATVIHRHANLGRLKRRLNAFLMVDVAGILMTAVASTAILIHRVAPPGLLKMKFHRTTER